MARIRTIKPEFPQSESMGRVSRESRLCFILLWTISDDVGRLRGNSRMLASLLYPYDNDAPKRMDGWLSELEHENCLTRYEVDGNAYIEIRNWLTHQKIDKPSTSKIPPFDESSRILANPRERSSGDLRIKEGIKDQGREGIKDLPSARASRKPALEDPEFSEFKALYPPRAGSQPWPPALRAARARIAEGHTWGEMHEGVRRYAEFCRVTGKLRTEYVQQASKFLGPSKPFLESWVPPATRADIRLASNLDAADEFLRRTEHAA